MTEEMQVLGGTSEPGRGDAELAALLTRYFPAAFPAGDKPPVPLKAGIHEDLRELPRPLSRKSRRVPRFLGKWVRRPAYLKAMTAGRPRIDLRGRPVGEVTEEQAAVAAMELERRAAVKAALAAG